MSASTLRRFYEAFAARDAETMASCYAPDAFFQDPVFRLQGSDIGDMWRMLIERGPDLRIEYELHDATHASWIARYRFQGRPVRNEIRSSFELGEDGAILREVDEFDFPAWARQALGPKGLLLGRTRFLRRAVQRGAAAGLESWKRRRAAGGPAPS